MKWSLQRKNVIQWTEGERRNFCANYRVAESLNYLKVQVNGEPINPESSCYQVWDLVTAGPFWSGGYHRPIHLHSLSRVRKLVSGLKSALISGNSLSTQINSLGHIHSHVFLFMLSVYKCFHQIRTKPPSIFHFFVIFRWIRKYAALKAFPPEVVGILFNMILWK